MRYAKRNAGIFTALTVCLFAAVLISAAQICTQRHRPDIASPLEYLLDLDGSVSEGNDWGDVLSIDGVPIAAVYTGEDGTEKYCALPGYTSIVGSPSGGLIYACRNILLANGRISNLKAHKGNTIITTLHSRGMLTASRQLEEYPEEVNAYICVVLRDGAVLVSQGNNSYTREAFFEPDKYKDLYVDYCACHTLKGSAFKPLTLRMLLLHDSELGKEYSLYEPCFKDYNQVTVRGDTVINWDSYIIGNYETDEGGGLYSRTLSLSDALRLSANTYVLRHADRFGLENTYSELCSLYSLDKTLPTEINGLTVSKVDPERYAYFPWGQDADISAVQMCQMYNYMVGGRFYAPFYCTGVRDPEGKVIYTAEPEELKDKHLNIDPDTDILDNALADTFCSYLTEEQLERYSDLIQSRRLLAKSGTADIADESVDRVVMLTVLNEERTEVICSACMCIDRTFDYDIQNSYMLEKLLVVLSSMGII